MTSGPRLALVRSVVRDRDTDDLVASDEHDYVLPVVFVTRRDTADHILVFSK